MPQLPLHGRYPITKDDSDAFFGALSRLTIDVEPSHNAVDIIRASAAAAERFGLTAYDAAYVQLAERDGLMLATLDRRMREAAAKAGVSVYQQP